MRAEDLFIGVGGNDGRMSRTGRLGVTRRAPPRPLGRPTRSRRPCGRASRSPSRCRLGESGPIGGQIAPRSWISAPGGSRCRGAAAPDLVAPVLHGVRRCRGASVARPSWRPARRRRSASGLSRCYRGRRRGLPRRDPDGAPRPPRPRRLAGDHLTPGGLGRATSASRGADRHGQERVRTVPSGSWRVPTRSSSSPSASPSMGRA